MTIDEIIDVAIKEDIGTGDHTSLATIPAGYTGEALIAAKQNGIIAGIVLSEKIFQRIDPSLRYFSKLQDGDLVEPGMAIARVNGNIQSILKAERLVLNFMQRMSGIATATREIADTLKGLKTKILDTRKTTPVLREIEKYAVRIGGGFNHRMGLYDMILIKDNHVDYSGGITKALQNVKEYLEKESLDIPVEIEVRNLDELTLALKFPGIRRVLLDNFSVELLKKAVEMVNGKVETEASGGITLQNARSIAETGVDYISMGALTHHIKSLDIHMVAV